MNSQKLILSLIKDDLINIKLISSLQSIGLYSDRYHLHLSSTIFELMGFENNKMTDEIYDRYIELTDQVVSIDILDSDKGVEKLSLENYKELCHKKN